MSLPVCARRRLQAISRHLMLAGSAFCIVAAAPTFAQTSPAPSSPSARNFNIPAQSLRDALRQLMQQGNLQIGFEAADVDGKTSAAVVGHMSAGDALSRLLSGTGLTFRYLTAGSVVLERAPQAAGEAIQLGPLRVEGQQGSGGTGREGTRGSGAAGGSDIIFATPRAMSEITREEMDRTPARHAADLLVATPGVSSTVNRLDPGLSVNIRGMQDFGRVNMMIDGMRQNFVRNGHQQRNGQMYLDPELISAITIERGPRTDVHGAGAIAGTVNFQTLDFTDLLDDGEKIGARLRGSTGLGAEGNGVNFIGSAAAAGRIGDRIELLGAYSRRSVGDYDAGKHGGGDNTALEYLTANGLERVSNIRYARQGQDSALAKLRFNLGEDHWLQFTYAGTWIDYDNVSEMINVLLLDPNGSPWRQLGPSKIGSQNFSLDYSWKPGSDLIDLKLKLYTVRTRNRNYTNAMESSNPDIRTLTESGWQLGLCERDPIPAAWRTACTFGIGTDQIIQTRTNGAQFDNTSRFDLGRGNKLSINFGGEFYRDKAGSDITVDREGRVLDTYNQYGLGELLNPDGRRTMASGFVQATLETGLYTLSAGLRYDHYWLRGETQIPGVITTYQDRFARFLQYHCLRTSALNQAGCAAAREGGEPAAIAWIEPIDRRGYWNNNNYLPQWFDQRGMYDYAVDTSRGRFLPSFSAAIKPTGWLNCMEAGPSPGGHRRSMSP